MFATPQSRDCATNTSSGRASAIGTSGKALSGNCGNWPFTMSDETAM